MLPNNLETKKCEFIISDKDDYKEILTWDEMKKCINRCTTVNAVDESIDVSYIVDVKCGWHKALDCELCYPYDVLKEKPIIQTSETSVVPIQRILLNKNIEGKKQGGKNKKNIDNNMPKVKSIDFFEKDEKGNYLFKDYLYQGHTVRGEHHFQYYIRTNHLFADIISNNIPVCINQSKKKFDALKEFENYCKQAKNNIQAQLKPLDCNFDDVVHIIISPSHFSSKMFCNAINKYVFDFKAHVISFDPLKEYRSSFETKYSNYAYFSEQIKEMCMEKAKISRRLFFYFVDDQIITGSNFYRITSLVKNLFNSKENNNSDNSLKVFEKWNGVFVVVNRNSNSTKYDYVDNIAFYYSLFDIAVPSVRSYADSCPMCKMRADAQMNAEKSILDCNAYHWIEKMSWLKLNTLSETKYNDIKIKKKNKKSYEELKDRKFRRFYCENEFHKNLSLHRNCENIQDILIRVIKNILDKNNQLQCEYLISCIKAISRPFIYYREDVKQPVLRILIGLTEGLLENKSKLKDLPGTLLLYKYDKNQYIDVEFRKKEEVYILLEILINCLASIDSNYLLKYDENGNNINEVCKIAELLDFVKTIFGSDSNKVLTFNPINLDDNYKYHSFYMTLLNAIKRIILGISGKYKSEKLEQILLMAEKNKIVQDYLKTHNEKNVKTSIFDLNLVQAIFLENSVDSIDKESFRKEFENEYNLIEKYKKIVNKICPDSKSISMQFLYYDEEMLGCEKFEVFIIDEEAQLQTIEEILVSNRQKESDNNIDPLAINADLKSIGYHFNGNKFLIKLHGYIEKDIEDERNDVKKSEKEVYLLIEFSEKVGDIKQRLSYIRDILKYRHALTSEIRSDIDSGAIKSAVQAAASKRFLHSKTLSDHGGVKDWETLMLIISKDIVGTTKDIRQKGYELLNVLMNEIISLGATYEILCEYFTGKEKGKIGDLKAGLSAGTQMNKNKSKDILLQYFIDKEQPSIKYNNKTYNLCNNNGYYYGNETLNLNFDIYPLLFPYDKCSSDNDEIGRISLLGLIIILESNADKYGKKESDDKVKKLIEIKTMENGYTITVENEYQTKSIDMVYMLSNLGVDVSDLIDNEKSNRAIAKERQSGKFTRLFLMKFLPRLTSTSGGRYSVVMESKKDRFKSVIKVNKEK